MNTFLYIFLGILGLCVIWSLWGYFSSRVETIDYSVIESKREYEIRLYPTHIIAQTTVKGSYEDALNQGFRILATYIFGDNVKKENIAMTSPVIEKTISASSSQQSMAEPIAMTAPVTATVEGDVHSIAFGMPRSYTLDTLPTPRDPRIEIRTIPEKKMAVIRFSWFRNSAHIESKKQELLNALKKDNVTVTSEPQYAGYDAPWTPPWMTRNEVLVEIK